MKVTHCVVSGRFEYIFYTIVDILWCVQGYRKELVLSKSVKKRLNFSDQSHFSNSFKKIYGMTPCEFRKTIQ